MPTSYFFNVPYLGRDNARAPTEAQHVDDRSIAGYPEFRSAPQPMLVAGLFRGKSFRHMQPFHGKEDGSMQYLKRSFLSIVFLLGVMVASSQAQPVPVTVTWDAYPWPHEIGTFRLEYSVNSQTVWYDNGSLPGGDTSVDTSAGAGVCFRLIAVPTTADALLGWVESAPSNVACYVVPVSLPAPTGLQLSQVTVQGQQRLRAQWTPYSWPETVGTFGLERRGSGGVWSQRGTQSDGMATSMLVSLRPFTGCFRLIAHLGAKASPPSQTVCR